MTADGRAIQVSHHCALHFERRHCMPRRGVDPRSPLLLLSASTTISGGRCTTNDRSLGLQNHQGLPQIIEHSRRASFDMACVSPTIEVEISLISSVVEEEDL